MEEGKRSWDGRISRVRISPGRDVLLSKESPRTGRCGGSEPASSVGRIPDQGEHIRVILAGGAAEVGIEPARSELRRGEAEAHIVVARALRFPDPARADFDALGHHAVVRLLIRVL